MKRIVLTGGGTAGHVTPNLALIPPLQQEGWEVHYIGTHDGIEKTLIEKVPGVHYHPIHSGKLRRYFDIKNFTDPFRVVQGVFEASHLMGQIKPRVLFSKGGFVSVPVVYGASMHRVPVLLHESDMTPGLANKLCLPFAKCVLTTFPETAQRLGKKGVHAGSPMRPELFLGKREKGLALCSFSGNKPVLMMTGGSLGAKAINEVLRTSLPELLKDFDVVHLCGKGHFDDSLKQLAGYRQFEYVNEEMPDIFACADVLLSRAGSNSLSEILALHKPAILVPWPKEFSRGDQVDNANSAAGRGLAMVLEQANLTPETLVQAAKKIYQERGMFVRAMRSQAQQDGVKAVLAAIHTHAKA